MISVFGQGIVPLGCENSPALIAPLPCQDDEIPRFNMEAVKVAVPEDVGADTPLPDLNLVVDDADTSRNAEYDLVIEAAEEGSNSGGVFSVHPDRAVGRTPVIIRVANPEYLDYESEGGREFSFR